MLTFGRGLLVLVGVIALTSISIDATDTLRGSQSALSRLATELTSDSCLPGTILIDEGGEVFCVDEYENSFNDSCPYTASKSISESQVNVERSDCMTVSNEAIMPATYVTYHQAQLFCAKRHMRLPTPEEWFTASLGTPDSLPCNVDGAKVPSRGDSSCRSVYGVEGLVGNVWEWVAGEVTDGVYNGTKLPDSGYVSEISPRGIPLTSSTTPSEQFKSDYVWSEEVGTFALMRGGYYGSKTDAGVYSLYGTSLPSYASEAVGFRCVHSL